MDFNKIRNIAGSLLAENAATQGAPPPPGDRSLGNEEAERFIKTIASGRIPISEDVINRIIGIKAGDDYSVKINDGFLTLKTQKIEVDMAFHSHCFKGKTKSATFKILGMRPFYYKLLVGFAGIKMPYLKVGKDVDKTRLVTCHLNQIPSLSKWSAINHNYIEDLTVEYIECKEGMATVGLKVNWCSLAFKIPGVSNLAHAAAGVAADIYQKIGGVAV